MHTFITQNNVLLSFDNDFTAILYCRVTSKRYPRHISTTSTTTQRGPVLSNTTLTVLRLFGMLKMQY